VIKWQHIIKTMNWKSGLPISSNQTLIVSKHIWHCYARYLSHELASSIPDMHNIRPAGQMWPAEAFNLAREAPNFVYFACFFDKNTLWMCYNLWILALGYVKKIFLGPPWDLSCAPLLYSILTKEILLTIKHIIFLLQGANLIDKLNHQLKC
jgi:hypothetical protein